MAKKSFRQRFLIVSALFVFGLLSGVRISAQLPGSSGPSLPVLLAEFKEKKQLPCGRRDEALRIGAEIIGRFRNDPENYDVVRSVSRQYYLIESQELRCNSKGELTLVELLENFNALRKLRCGQSREAAQIGREVIERFGSDPANKEAVDFVKTQTAEMEQECKGANSLETLFEEYKLARKRPCGERSGAIQTGKQIIDLHGADETNDGVISFVEKDTAKIQEQDRICQRNDRYNQSYKTKNWRAFYAVSKEIIDEEGDNPLALDVMLTLVSVGYSTAAHDIDTIFYAKKAIDLIESGVTTQSRWGIFEPYGSKDKALAWLNYSIGYISYFRLKEGKKVIPYFYKATQFPNVEFKYDAFVYQAVAIHYFEKKAVTPSSITINEFLNKAGTLGSVGGGDDSTEEIAKNNEAAMLYKQLVNLYNLRYNLEPNENVTDLTDYIMKLINRPLVNTAVKDKSKASPPTNY